jgi:acyl-CoA thioesterase FadM
VRIGDINYGGHMGNDRFLLLFHDARLQFLASLGASEKDIGGGAGLIMSEAHVSFKAEVFLGDELTVTVSAKDMQGSRFLLDYTVERVSDRAIAATGYTRMVAFDYGLRRVCRIPEAFRVRLEAASRPPAGPES